MSEREKYNSSPAPDQQCDDCQWNWKYMGASEGGHCYMFKAREDDCYKRRPVQENEKVSDDAR